MNLRVAGPTPCPPEVLAATSRQMFNHRFDFGGRSFLSGCYSFTNRCLGARCGRDRIAKGMDGAAGIGQAACWSRWIQPATATTNSVKGRIGVLMTEDSSFPLANQA